MGSNPHSISQVLVSDGIKYKEIKGFGDMEEPGIYIVSFWNDMGGDSMLHTIAVKVPGDNGAPYTAYNGDKEGIPDNQFIAGYKVSRK